MVRRWFVLFGIMVTMVSVVTMVNAAPTPINRTVSWDHDGQDVAGFRVYFARQTTPGYTNVNRVEIPDPTVRTIAVLDITTQTGALCFVVTAYDTAGNESAYSNEACGFFGVTAPGNVRVQ